GGCRAWAWWRWRGPLEAPGDDETLAALPFCSTTRRRPVASSGPRGGHRSGGLLLEHAGQALARAELVPDEPAHGDRAAELEPEPGVGTLAGLDALVVLALLGGLRARPDQRREHERDRADDDHGRPEPDEPDVLGPRGLA